MSKIYCKEKLNRASKKKFLLDYFIKLTPETYFNQECSISQCRPRKSRSIGDLKMLLDGAFKTETPKDYLIKMLLSLINLKEDEHVVRCLYCNNVDKLVFYSSSVHPSYWEFSIEDTLENRWNGPGKESPIDGYSWNSLVKIYLNKTK